jgi:hypothetical protein
VARNTIAYGNAGEQFNHTSANTSYPALVACAGSSFSSSFLAAAKVDCQTLSADPFLDAANGNFSPNKTANAGALVRKLGSPVTFPGTSTTSNLDIGAATRRDPTVPTAAQVLTTIGFGDGGTEFTGTHTDPTEAQVEEGVQWGAGGTEFTGTLEAGQGGGFIFIGD